MGGGEEGGEGQFAVFETMTAIAVEDFADDRRCDGTAHDHHDGDREQNEHDGDGTRHDGQATAPTCWWRKQVVM